LREDGHEVFSPAEHDREAFPDLDWPNMTGDTEKDGIPPKDIRDVIKADLVWICPPAEPAPYKRPVSHKLIGWRHDCRGLTTLPQSVGVTICRGFI